MASREKLCTTLALLFSLAGHEKRQQVAFPEPPKVWREFTCSMSADPNYRARFDNYKAPREPDLLIMEYVDPSIPDTRIDHRRVMFRLRTPSMNAVAAIEAAKTFCDTGYTPENNQDMMMRLAIPHYDQTDQEEKGRGNKEDESSQMTLAELTHSR